MAVDGTYKITTQTMMGPQEATLIMKSDGTSLSGSMESQAGKAEFAGGTVSGNEYQFKVKVKTPLGDTNLDCKGTIDGDKLTGTASAPFPIGTMKSEGNRVG